MAAVQAFGGTAGALVLAGSGFMPARFMLVPAGTRLPPGVHAVAAVPATPVVASVGSGSRAMGLVARAAGRADHGVLDLDDDATNAALASLSIGDAVATNAPASLSLDDATNARVLAYLSIGDTDATGPAGGGPAKGTAGAGGLFFLGGDASGFGSGISSAALASATGGSASRGARLVVAATAGSDSEGDDLVDNGSTADSTKMDLFLARRYAVLLSWECVDVDRSYRDQAFFGDLEEFNDSANRGMLLMRVLLDKGLDYSNGDMWVLGYAGQCLSRVFHQSKLGSVSDGAVIEATRAVQFVCLRLLPDVLVSAGSGIDPVVAYSKERAQALTKLIDGVAAAVA